jgi:RNA recognition motif-containing protein
MDSRAHAEQAIQRFNGQVFNGRPLAVSEARARRIADPADRGPVVLVGGHGRRVSVRVLAASRRVTLDRSAARRPFDAGRRRARLERSRNFGPDAKPQRGGQARRARRRRRQAARSDSAEETPGRLQPRRRRRVRTSRCRISTTVGHEQIADDQTTRATATNGRPGGLLPERSAFAQHARRRRRVRSTGVNATVVSDCVVETVLPAIRFPPPRQNTPHR